jgi:hypothetical protein
MGSSQDNQWSRDAKEWAQRTGGDPIDYFRKLKETATAEELIGIKTAEKFMNLRNKSKVRRGGKPMRGR